MRLLLGMASGGVVGLSLVLVGAALAFKQQRLLVGAAVVPGIVREAGRTDAGVRVVYDYTLGVTVYRRDQLAPLPVKFNLSMPAAHAQLTERRPGERVEVYVARDGRAFLLPVAQAYPYLLMWLGLGLGLLVLTIARRSGVMDAPPAPARLHGSDWHALAGTRTPADAVAGRLVEALGWCIVTGTCAGLYLWAAPTPYDPLIGVCALGLIPVVLGALGAARWARLASTLAAVELTTMKATLELDQPVLAHVRLTVNAPLPLREARLALVCRRRRGLAAAKLYLNSCVLAKGCTLCPLTPLAEHGTFEVPRCKHRASSPFDRFTFPRVEWCFELHLHPRRGRRYVLRFPVAAALTATAKMSATRPAAQPRAA